VKLTIHVHLFSEPRIVEAYLHSSIHFRGPKLQLLDDDPSSLVDNVQLKILSQRLHGGTEENYLKLLSV
jgi:hypothetical protein